MAKLKTLLLLGVVVFLEQSLAHAEVITTVAAQTRYDDNIYRMEKNTTDSWVTVVTPDAQIVINQGASSYTLEGGAESGVYSHSEMGSDDYTDYHLSGLAQLRFDLRNSLDVNMVHSNGHDDRGTARTDVVTKFTSPASITALDMAEPDQWKKDRFFTEYTYGEEDATGRIVLNGQYLKTDYINHTLETSYLNNYFTEYRAIGYLKQSTRLSYLLEARTKDQHFDDPMVAPPALAGQSRDKSENKYFVGARWDSTAKTEGSIRLGYQEETPDSKAFKGLDSTAWEAEVLWRPKTYSVFMFTTNRSIELASDALTYVTYDEYTASWKHGWSSALTSELYYSQGVQTYENSISRVDTTDAFGLNTRYALNSWLALTANYRYEDRRSTRAFADFTRNKYLLGAEATFR